MKSLLRLSLIGLMGVALAAGILATGAEAKPVRDCERLCDRSTCVGIECCLSPGGVWVCKEMDEPCC